MGDWNSFRQPAELSGFFKPAVVWPVRGDWLVELRGFELAARADLVLHLITKSSCTLHEISSAVFARLGPFIGQILDKKQKALPKLLILLALPRGIEPLTSAVRLQRSPI